MERELLCGELHAVYRVYATKANGERRVVKPFAHPDEASVLVDTYNRLRRDAVASMELLACFPGDLHGQQH